MNILFIAGEYNLFDKIDCGAATRSTMLIKALAQIGHVDVISFSKNPLQSTVSNCDVVYNQYVKSVSRSEIIRRYLLFVFNPFNPRGYYRHDKRREAIVEKYYLMKDYDIVACRYISEIVSCGLLKYQDKLVVDVDDNLKNLFKKDVNSQEKTLLGRILLRIKIVFVEMMCKKVLRRVKCSYFSNISEPPYDGSIYLHNVPSISEKPSKIDNESPKRILCVGNLDYSPNKTGLTYFIDRIYPVIREEVPDIEIHIVGKSNDKGLIDYIESKEGASCLGYVSNILEEYKGCRVVIVPVYQGAGSCVKFVEGLFSNRPIVSTPMGARGFNSICQSGVHFMQAESDQEFAKATIDLLLSVDRANKMAQLAYEVGQQNFSQQRFLEIVKESVLATI